MKDGARAGNEIVQLTALAGGQLCIKGWFQSAASRLLQRPLAESRCAVLGRDYDEQKRQGINLRENVNSDTAPVHTATASLLTISISSTSGLRAAGNFVPFLFFNRMSVAKPRIYDFFCALRAGSNLPIGAAGFCWGGLLVTHTSL